MQKRRAARFKLDPSPCSSYINTRANQVQKNFQNKRSVIKLSIFSYMVPAAFRSLFKLETSLE
jgi:hypothetical protein